MGFEARAVTTAVSSSRQAASAGMVTVTAKLATVLFARGPRVAGPVTGQRLV